MKTLTAILASEAPITLSEAPEGLDALAIAELARLAYDKGRDLCHIARNDARVETISDALAFFAPDIEVLVFPAWDCLPYDRVSPKPTILSARMDTLSRLVRDKPSAPRLILTTINAVLQRTPPQSLARTSVFEAQKGDQINEYALLKYLETNGYHRTDQVSEPGEYAKRGGLIDIYPAGMENPIRLDLFGDELDEIRSFDALSQRTIDKIDAFRLEAANEFELNDDSIRRFRKGYHEAFGAVTDDDQVYEAISTGRRPIGVEHWLPLFHEKMETLFDYLGTSLITTDHQVDDAASSRFETIDDYFSARMEALENSTRFGAPYKPLPPERLYLTRAEWAKELGQHSAHAFTPFMEPEADNILSLGGKRGRDFTPERKESHTALYKALLLYIDRLRGKNKRIVFAAYSEGARDRLTNMLAEHGVNAIEPANTWAEVKKQKRGTIAFVVLPLETGFEGPDFALITETDLLGDRLIRKAKKAKKAENFISEASSLAPGDLVVHINHGIGRFDGLETLTVGGAAHDCLRLIYQGDDKLYLPVENIEMLSRFGGDDASLHLDKLGGSGWQHRHAKMKKRIREMADTLIKVAADRQMRTGAPITVPKGMYEEFVGRFPYTETDDQARSIDDVINDLSMGRPMDRLVCGDVGFGKTEVALRTAFIAAMNGVQVAVVTPTTLLCRQHFQGFKERFEGFPVRIEQLSRMVTPSHAKEVRAGLESGQVDIVIGTHALLSKNIKFKDLGLLIIDEEQHFGVAHKERLKAMRSDVHVLTLTATPIPRTLQLAMSGIRDLSLIATPPVDRLAVRTYVLPFDPIVVKEALMREHFRGGQSFYVVPRIEHLPEVQEYLAEHVPDVKVVVAHGQMPVRQIEDAMNAFYEGKYDVLLSTTIIESGLDIPRANTMIIHRADMFGLSQLYQLRGRVGRSKLRAYAYLTVPPKMLLTESAEKRLQVMQSLDTLGGGFSVASHDMDIRGSGNLLGEEQSGHVREVGVELYQQMLEKAVAEARAGVSGGDNEVEDDFSPVINIGAAVLIPEGYVEDLNLRMALYRRIGQLVRRDDIEAFAAEMIDRFGPLPKEVKQLLNVIRIKAYCKVAGIEKIDAGAKGVTITFRNSTFQNPAGLVEFISKRGKVAKVRPNHTLVYLANWKDDLMRLRGVMDLAKNLAKIAIKGTK